MPWRMRRCVEGKGPSIGKKERARWLYRALSVKLTGWFSGASGKTHHSSNGSAALCLTHIRGRAAGKTTRLTCHTFWAIIVAVTEHFLAVFAAGIA